MALVCSVVNSQWLLPPPPSPPASKLWSDGGPIKAIANGIAVVKKDTSETKMTLSLVTYNVTYNDDFSCRCNAQVTSVCGSRYGGRYWGCDQRFLVDYF